MANKRVASVSSINDSLNAIPCKKRKLHNTATQPMQTATSSTNCKEEKKKELEEVAANTSPILFRAKSTISITFGDAAENHVGMEIIGKLAAEGFTVDDLQKAEQKFIALHQAKTELVTLNEYLPKDQECDSTAAVLIIRNGVQLMLESMEKSVKDLYAEQATLPIDTKYFDRRRKKVLNKNARGNLCFAENGHAPDYEHGKGTVVAYDRVPLTKYIRERLPVYFGEKANELAAEGNYYYDIAKCGIGFHGDAERKKVIAFRLGQSMPLHYQWFARYKAVGERCKLSIHEGDIYAMSEKATGFDWKKSSVLTLRHAAGAEKYLTIKEKKRNK
eukprot:CAMPEP_0197031150 /NCGR_PEP_ID=MMETSP1384-20130603/10237_1 /TAXON_ID=29189 /ORGANISM="Ammonia sp." /LENGTH=331 /DNA_ID=CAMNT_0042460639 /DNA_START=69 /DNA_END=1064 /DNA_ORIENTATION=-